jgi:hypothetical protein
MQILMEAIRPSETSVPTRITRRNIPEDGILHWFVSFVRWEYPGKQWEWHIESDQNFMCPLHINRKQANIQPSRLRYFHQVIVLTSRAGMPHDWVEFPSNYAASPSQQYANCSWNALPSVLCSLDICRLRCSSPLQCYRRTVHFYFSPKSVLCYSRSTWSGNKVRVKAIPVTAGRLIIHNTYLFDCDWVLSRWQWYN